MCLLRNVAKRYAGMGLKIMKFHALVHLVEDMLLFGTPSEYDTGSNESHHKPSKYAAKLTQRNEATFILQSAIRITEFLVLELALFELENGVSVQHYFGDFLDEVRKARADDDEESWLDDEVSWEEPMPQHPLSEAEEDEEEAECLEMQERPADHHLSSDEEEGWLHLSRSEKTRPICL